MEIAFEIPVEILVGSRGRSPLKSYGRRVINIKANAGATEGPAGGARNPIGPREAQRSNKKPSGKGALPRRRCDSSERVGGNVRGS